MLRVSRFSFRSYASVTNVRHLQSNGNLSKSIQDRYKEKLENAAKQKGLSSAQELKQQLKAQIEASKLEMNKIDPLNALTEFEQQQAKANIKKQVKSLGPIDPTKPKEPYKTLNSFIKLDKMKELGKTEIEFLWRARFNDPNALVATVPLETFDVMYKLARRNPTFVLPLPKEDAQLEENVAGEGTPLEMHFVQWAFVGPETTHCMITSLMEFKLHKEYARPHTTIAFHSELKDKEVILMNGTVEKESAMTIGEAQMLLLNLQRFYGAMGVQSDIALERIALLEAFNRGGEDFEMEKLVKLSQSMEN